VGFDKEFFRHATLTRYVKKGRKYTLLPINT
jgi:hypothetical protein